MDFSTQWVNTTDQQRLFVKLWGDSSKPALVLVHGYPDNQEVWEPVIQQLIADFYIVTYDVRGAGQSSVPRKVRDYRLAQLSQDLDSVTQAVLGDRPFHLAAHDWGSIQSWESVTEPKFRSKILSYSTISGPCLDHAAFWLRDQFKQRKAKFFKQISKSWYIAVFQLPFLAPTAWHFFNPERWGKVVTELERTPNLPLNANIQHDGKNGVGLYRANFISSLTRPRKRHAICPVQAIVLKYDNFVSPELIDALPQWVEDLSVVEVKANHWAILSQPENIATYIRTFAQRF
ncbi:alpha/beta hydrolase [Acinetobacter sp. ANC 5054]|uniref:alpha/beta fold hydrolase n=1 Tax=Acinetobacter sp. ANC 5054 TaxID=1977877 RepID=UPI000A342769|nr:alpha/beta fold hydrolase [Acinetobacter sp. ANC 5054]OTG84391.1 alpha/beta hydrolase [Acinetobacter sp. ANC 5054]